MVKKTLAASILLIATGSFAQANTFNGKTTAMSDTGVATSSYLEGMNLNPAALATFEGNDDFNLHLNGGALGSDEDDLLDNAEDLTDALDRLDGQLIGQAEVDEVIFQLREISGKTAVVEAGAGLYMNIPTNLISVGLFGRSQMSVGVISQVDEGDIALLENAVGSMTPFDSDDLNSSVMALGAMVTEAGLTFARQVGPVSVGVTPKHQKVEIIEYVAHVNNFDEDDFDADDYLTEDSNFNVDLGLQAAFGNWQLGATLANALEEDYESISGRIVTIEPRVTVGAGYRNSWLTAALDVDANSTANLITREESRFARVGIEMDAFGWAQLRFGYKSDLESVLDDTVSVGLGLSPFGVINLDIAAVSGENDTVGAALQLGFSF
ncbi:conjugal transfer protein TraF [Gilvimarinus sp. F26214L]|uniref:conjugal transfer protein TraF n=1 Tax=Gilvimarinus sp. DZF01 TaxID=3461371 RepID=UPI00404532EE